MVTIEQVTNDTDPWNILLYADSGAGKTVYALKDKRVLVLELDPKGSKSAVSLGITVNRIKVPDWEAMMEVNNYLWDNQDVLENYDVLVIDGLTEADSMIMRYILKVTNGAKLAKDTDPDIPWIDDYGKRNILLEKLVRSLNDLPINCFYTALPRIAEDPDAKEFLVPMLGGNKATDYRFSMKIVALMTSFAYMRVETVNVPAPTEEEPNKTKKQKQRVTYWEDTSFSKGKDRTNRLAPKTVNFTMQHMRLCIDGKITREGKAIRAETETKTVTKPAPKVEAEKESVKVRKPVPQASPAPDKEVASEESLNAVKAFEEKAKAERAKAAQEKTESETEEEKEIDLVDIEP